MLDTRPVEDLSKTKACSWWGSLEASTPRAWSRTFQLLHNMMAGAFEHELIDSSR
jgi:hypothetical protein